MTGMGRCDLCKEDVPSIDLLMHITQHGLTPERWPDGGIVDVRVPAPEMFRYSPLTDQDAAVLMAAIRGARWRRMWARLRMLLRK